MTGNWSWKFRSRSMIRLRKFSSDLNRLNLPMILLVLTLVWKSSDGADAETLKKAFDPDELPG